MMTRSTPLWPHTAVLMIGGRSRRMGTPKHGLKFPDGRTMLDATIDCLIQMSARQVISGPEHIQTERKHILDTRPGSGPIGAIESVLKSGLDESYLFVPCDMPNLKADTLRRLAVALDDAEATIFKREEEGVRPVLPLGLRCSTATRLQEVIEHGNQSVHQFLTMLDVATVPLLDDESDCLMNINTPEEWTSYLTSHE